MKYRAMIQYRCLHIALLVFQRLRAIIIPGLLGIVFMIPWISMAYASNGNIEGTWVGVVVLYGQQGDAEIVINKAGGSYIATYHGPIGPSGQLHNVHYGSGKEANTMTLTMASSIFKFKQNEAVLRFYLLQEPNKPQLYGIMKLDVEVGKDLDFSVVFERQPCCESECIHPGKSRCY